MSCQASEELYLILSRKIDVKEDNNITTSEADIDSQNYKNNAASFDPQNNPLHKAVIEGVSGVSNLYYEAADKAVFEIFRGWYPGISFKEMLVCWQAYWAKSDHGFPAYDEVIARLEKSKADEIPEDLRKEFHVVNDRKDSQSLLLFPSEWDVKRAISHAHRRGYIRYEITEYTSYGPGIEKPDPDTLVWRPAILILLDDKLYKELDEATNQICASSVKQFFPSSPPLSPK